jgi:hypothetical protein
MQFQHGRPVCHEAILDWSSAVHHLLILPDALRHVIRRTDAFKTIWGIPIESGRCQVTIEEIQESFARLEQGIENVPAAFIFNADESGFQDFVDSQEAEVIVLAAFKHDSVPFPSD